MAYDGLLTQYQIVNLVSSFTFWPWSESVIDHVPAFFAAFSPTFSPVVPLFMQLRPPASVAEIHQCCQNLLWFLAAQTLICHSAWLDSSILCTTTTIKMPDSKCRLSLTFFNELQICSFNCGTTGQTYVQALRNSDKDLFKHGLTHNTNVQCVGYNLTHWYFVLAFKDLKTLSLRWYTV